MVNLWLSNNAGRLRLGTEDFKDSKQDAPRMASFAVEAVQRIGADHVSAIVTDGPSVMRKSRRLFKQRPGCPLVLTLDPKSPEPLLCVFKALQNA